MRPLERAASAHSGLTASTAKTLVATAAASATLKPTGILRSSDAESSEADAAVVTRTAAAGRTAARDLRRRDRGAGRRRREARVVRYFHLVAGIATRTRAPRAGDVGSSNRAHLTATPMCEARRAAATRGARTTCE
jgi:hypothetical protein